MSFIKDIWETEISDNNFLEDWPNFLRWLVAVPFSLGGYALIYSFIRIFRDDLGAGTFLGSLFVYVGSATIPIYIFYSIIPKYKNILSLIVLSSIIVIRITGFLIDTISIYNGTIELREIFVETVPNLISVIIIIFFIKIVINSFKGKKGNFKL
jgi:hypothetical protein